MKIKKIALLAGGWSPEREVSLNSGKNIAEGLKRLGFEVCEIDVKKDLKHITDKLYDCRPDFVFNTLHGIGGEDGVIQGILEVFGVPYNNSDVLSSAITFDKSVCKKLVKTAGVRVVDGFDITSSDIQNINTPQGINVNYPFVVKPSDNGSTIGVFLIFNDEDLQNLKNTKWTFGEKVIIEKYIKGREFTTLTLDGKAIGAIEITYKNKLYDYSSKYDVGGSFHLSHFNLGESNLKEMLDMSEKAFKVCCCRGIARADFRYDNERVYFLELNTQPGMTSLSLVPDIAKFNGISFENLLMKIIESSLKT
ncbi:MAG: D-alanine--D-alanine ligase [Holosporales bacterium]|jgi:D-alanine-D-alanine ligase|nr:D-alanine--D-alanine ligase [Holosporales bacterium]